MTLYHTKRIIQINVLSPSKQSEFELELVEQCKDSSEICSHVAKKSPAIYLHVIGIKYSIRFPTIFIFGLA